MFAGVGTGGASVAGGEGATDCWYSRHSVGVANSAAIAIAPSDAQRRGHAVIVGNNVKETKVKVKITGR